MSCSHNQQPDFSREDLLNALPPFGRLQLLIGRVNRLIARVNYHLGGSNEVEKKISSELAKQLVNNENSLKDVFRQMLKRAGVIIRAMDRDECFQAMKLVMNKVKAINLLHGKFEVLSNNLVQFNSITKRSRLPLNLCFNHYFRFD
ncbi:Oidioi.mRNA.OKI2018_I69.chr2.g7158.t1.cds [Oikopleura dioica]|uniref:Oidioi.mRNA.OKI2018_I69.chr2.g7158.t1.cds n=1 Tax=Oikopleura dioica TaxID=34765 RepID=A0ABN7TA19_OIKDI|nr:Oidioi.mRNA.OKI2018_I69.chr2.g7158.t1.cds [Oikopleura dioica]